MKPKVNQLHREIEGARKSFLAAISNLTKAQTNFKPAPKEWSILEITEHIVWAEQVGICGMFNAIDGIKEGTPIWSGTSPNEGLSIEEIVEKTWKPKEEVPKVAEPRWGGTIDFWICCLKNNAHLVEELISMAEKIDLTRAIYPHPISGPMDVLQRLEFLRFHMDRHLQQINRVKAHVNYPK